LVFVKQPSQARLGVCGDPPMCITVSILLVGCAVPSEPIGSQADAGDDGMVINSFEPVAKRQRLRLLPRLVDESQLGRVAVGEGSDDEGVGVIELVAPVVANGRVVAGVELKYGDFVEGVKLSVGTVSDGSYVRFHVKCPLRHAEHWDVSKECCKFRNVGPAQTKHFGIAEVYAYLGLFVRSANSFSDQRCHVHDFRPSVNDLKAYIDEQGWQL
jgi:hypothetical protein